MLSCRHVYLVDKKKKTFVDGSSRPSIASIRDAAAPKVSIGRALR